MRVRAVTITLTAVDSVAAAALVVIFFLFSGSDPATRGFDIAGAWLIALAGLPALLLAFMRRAPRTALVFALTFPVGFVLVYIAAVIAFII